MSLWHSTVVVIYLIVFVLSFCSFTLAAPTRVTGVAEVVKDNDFYYYIMAALFLHSDLDDIDEEEKKGRVKRQSGADKFSDAAKMSPTKVMQLYLSMFRNLVSTDPIGGVHPMSRDVPKPVVKLFKHRIIAFFFPDVGESKV